jgi:chemotaxis protein MotB
MGNKRVFLGLWLACLLILACESKEKYSELEATLSDTQAKLEQKSQQVQGLELKLRESEENRNKGQQDTAELQARYESLEKAQQQLSQTLKETNLELEKKNSIMQQKEEMIQELDDAKRQLETNLQSQIEAREKKIRELEKAISELDKTKRHFETNLMDLKEQRAVQEQKIIEQRNIIAELDATRLTIEDTLQIRQSQLKLRGKKIKEMENTIAQLDKTKHQIETNLQKQIKAQQVKLEEVEGKLKVTFIDKILFNSGSVRINQEGKDLLLTLAESFKQNKNHNIIVQGHTDNVLIKPEFQEKYPTNWELSAARSAAVVRYLQEKAGVDPERCVACGYSYYKPIASNLTEGGQQQNRRIEIILTPPR